MYAGRTRYFPPCGGSPPLKPPPNPRRTSHRTTFSFQTSSQHPSLHFAHYLFPLTHPVFFRRDSFEDCFGLCLLRSWICSWGLAFFSLFPCSDKTDAAVNGYIPPNGVCSIPFFYLLAFLGEFFVDYVFSGALLPFLTK